MSDLVFHNGRYLPRIIAELFPTAYSNDEGEKERLVRSVFEDSILTSLHKPNVAQEANSLTLEVTNIDVFASYQERAGNSIYKTLADLDSDLPESN